MAEEWKASKKWNPFNSAKLLAQVPRWENIIEGQTCPAPETVTIDPTNKCNLNCSWCNAKAVRSRGGNISTAMLERIAEFLGDWGVKAVCIAGGGEPMLHDGFFDLVHALVDSDIRIGVVTNGTQLLANTAPMLCDWIGVSVDAGKARTYELDKGKCMFGEVTHQMSNLRRKVSGTDMPLAKPGLGNGVFWKFLVTPSNVNEMLTAAQQAKLIGCKAIHFRPAGRPWDAQDEITFGRKQIKAFNNQLGHAISTLDDDRFSVYGVRHKFTKELKPEHNFKACHAVFMTCVFMPASDGNEEHFDVGFCCDRRGDRRMTLPNLQRPEQLLTFWGSTEHWDMMKRIDPHRDCPRCTYAPHNEIFESVVQRDDMTHVFI